MDFLLLLPSRVRVVIECDGQQHYADDTGKASPRRYAEMMATDRDLRLKGYEIYRFGGAELTDTPQRGSAGTRSSIASPSATPHDRHMAMKLGPASSPQAALCHTSGAVPFPSSVGGTCQGPSQVRLRYMPGICAR